MNQRKTVQRPNLLNLNFRALFPSHTDLDLKERSICTTLDASDMVDLLKVNGMA